MDVNGLSVPMRAKLSVLLRHVLISPLELLALNFYSVIAASPRKRDLRVTVLCGLPLASQTPAASGVPCTGEGAFAEGGGQSVQG